MKVIILPGNNNTHITDYWYQDVKQKLEQAGLEVIAENMPDPVVARKTIWIPYIKKHIKKDEETILIGHSSGATAILSFLETHTCKAAILVGTYYTDLNDSLEKESGYFDKPWNWEAIKNNAEKIIIFAAENDPYIPIEEPRHIQKMLDAEYHEYSEGGHFSSDKDGNEKKTFPEIVEAVKKILEQETQES